MNQVSRQYQKRAPYHARAHVNRQFAASAQITTIVANLRRYPPDLQLIGHQNACGLDKLMGVGRINFGVPQLDCCLLP